MSTTTSTPLLRRAARAVYPAVLAIFGMATISFAAAFSSAAIEQNLRGAATGSLAWGPALFRTMLALHGLTLLAAGAYLWFRPSAGLSPARAQAQPRDHTSRGAWLLLAIILVLATALRLWRLDTGLWLDEIFMLADFVRPPIGQIITSFPTQNQHMFYSVVAHGLFAAFGESIWLYRLPAAAFGVGSIAALFFLARRVADTRTALMACALMTLSYHHIWFSQNARGYSGLLLFATLATWLWIEALPRGDRQWRWWIAYALSVALGMWLHLTMAFVPFVHGLTYLVLLARSYRQTANNGYSRVMASRWQPLAALVLSGTITLQLYALSLPEFLRLGLHEESKESSWTNPLWLITETLRGVQSGYAGLAVLVVAAGAIGASLGLWRIARRNWVAAVSMTLPGILLGTMIVSMKHNLWPRFFFFCAGFAILVAACGTFEVARLLSSTVSSLSRFRIPHERLAMAAWAVVLASSSLTIARCYALPKQDYGGARDYVRSVSRDEDVVVTVGLAAHAYRRYYAPEWPAPQTPEEFEEVRRGRRTWLVYTMPIHLKAFQPPMWDIVKRDFKVEKVFGGTLSGGEVFVCREAPHDASITMAGAAAAASASNDSGAAAAAAGHTARPEENAR